MILVETLEYVCALRWKKGEYEALGALDDPVKDRLAPHIILPPLSAKDIEKNRELSEHEVVDIQIGRIAKFWGRRPCFLDFRFIKFSDDQVTDGSRLGTFLNFAHKCSCSVIPIFELEMGEHRFEAIKDYWRSTQCGIAIRLSLADLGNPDLQSVLHRLLLRAVAKPSDCVLVLDLSEAELSDPRPFAVFIADWIIKLQDFGFWRRIVVEGSNYPEVNPAPANNDVTVARNEWLAWKEALQLEERIREVAMFGDFGADHGVIKFASGGRPITHFRYATPEGWLVVRGGQPTVKDDGSIRSVARRIVNSGFFAGERFCAGDEFIADCAAGRGGPGNPSDWRRANMNHHMTRVATDIASMLARPIPERQQRRRPVQQELFSESRGSATVPISPSRNP